MLLARLVQLGIRQSRYFGRVKTRFHLYLAATVANLTLQCSGHIPRHDPPSPTTQRTSLSALPGGFQSVGKRQPDSRTHIDASTLLLCFDFPL